MHILGKQLLRMYEVGSSGGVVANVLESDVVVSKFKLQSYSYVHNRTNTFGKGMKPLIPTSTGEIEPLLHYKYGFGIISHPEVDILRKNESKC